jgi:hypothetical protein
MQVEAEAVLVIHQEQLLQQVELVAAVMVEFMITTQTQSLEL